MTDSIKYILQFLNILTYFEVPKYLDVLKHHIFPKLFLKKLKTEKYKYYRQLHAEINKH